MKYTILFVLPLVLLMPIAQTVSAETNIMDKLTKAFQMLTSGDEHAMGNMTEMVDNKTSQLKSLIAELKFRSGLDTYVNFEPQGYGIYQEKELNTFMPGEKMILYIEPKGYEYGTFLDESGDKLYTMDFAIDFAISDESGNILTSQQGITFGDIVSHHKNKELFIPFTITQSSPFPDGNYIITYVIHDKNSGASFDIVKNITIAS